MFAARKMLSVNGEKVRRNLFGEVDHEQLKKDFEENMRDDMEKYKLKWNFDFEKGIPLDGKFEWSRVEGPPQKTIKQEEREDPHQETTTQEVLEEPLLEITLSKALDDLFQETTTQEGEDPIQETTAQEVLEDPLLKPTAQEKMEDSQQEVATQDGDTTSNLDCRKRKQSLITDHYPVKRRSSPLPSPSHCSQ